MRRWIGVLVALALVGVVSSCDDDAKPTASSSQEPTSTSDPSRLIDGEGFTARLPGDEVRRTVEDRSAGGQPYQLIRYEVDPSPTELLTIAVAEYPVDLEDLLDAGDLTFQALLQSAAQGGGATLKDDWADEVDGVAARTGRVTVTRDGYQGSGYATVVVEGRTLFQVVYVVDGTGDGTGRPPATYDSVIDSVTLD